MAPVDTTRTHADAHLEQRQVREDTALLVQQKDTLMREIAHWQPVLTAIRAQIAEHLHLPEVTKDIDKVLFGELAQKRDELHKEIEGKTAVRDGLDADIEAKRKVNEGHDADIGVKERRLEELKGEIERHTGMTSAAVGDHATKSEELKKDIERLEREKVDATASLINVKRDEEILLANRVNEDIRLAAKGRDLAIYESRIRVAAAKFDPPMVIIL